MHRSPTINIPHQSGAFVTNDEPILTHHCHPEYTVYFRAHSMFLDIICIISSYIFQSIFTALKILCALPIHPSLPPTPGNHWPFNCLHSLAFSTMPWSWSRTARSLIRLFFFFSPLGNRHSRILQVFSWLYSSTFLSTECLIVWLYHSLFFHLPPEGHVGCFQTSVILNTAAINICVRVFCVDVSFQLLWENTKVWLLDHRARVCLAL